MKTILTIHDHGFQAPEITPDQYVLGGIGGAKELGGKILMPGGHGWGDHRPAYETQNKNGLETMNCSNYGTNNAWETLMQFFWPKPGGYDFSERYTGVETGTSRNGNNPHDVAEKIRTECGLIPETVLPFSDEINTWEEYYAPSPMETAYLVQGQHFLNAYKLGHEWVFTSGTLEQKQTAIKYALQFSPLGISVFAWRKDSETDLYVKLSGDSDNHWVELLDFEEGEYWEIYDHYDGGIKHLAWDYSFGFAKRYSVEKNTAKKNWVLELFAAFVGAFKFLIPFKSKK